MELCYRFKKIASVILLFFCFCPSPTIQAKSNYAKVSKSDYILIINTYTESSDWSNSFIHPIYESILTGKSDLTVYTEHMSMLLISTEQELDTYKNELFAKYASKKPQAVVLLGNTPWEVFRADFEALWPDVPVIVCAEELYSGPLDYYIQKKAIPKEQRVLLTDYKGPLHLTLIYDPICLKQTIELMRMMIPRMDSILFLSDKRYVSAQTLADLEELLSTDYKDITLETITPNDISTNQMFDKLRNVRPTTGILYFSWYKTNSFANNTFITSNDYKMFSRYTSAPIFTLTDKSIGQVGMVGGYFINDERIKQAITNGLIGAVTGAHTASITIQNCGVPTPVLNYKALVEKDIPIELCPSNTIFYMKELTMWEQYKVWIIMAFLAICGGFSFLIMKMQMINRVKAKQEEKLLLIQDYSSLFANMPVAYIKKQLIYDDKGVIVDYLVTNVNPCFERYFIVGSDSPVGLHGTDSPSFREFVNLYKIAITENKEITAQYYHQANSHYYSMVIAPSKISGFMDVFYVDNNELATTQQMLSTLNHKLAMALDVANITPWRWDLESQTITCDINKATGTISDDPSEEHLTVPYREYFSKICKRDLPRVRKAYEDLIAGKTSKIREEYRVFVQQDHKRRYDWIEAQAVVDRRDDNGKPLSLIGSSLVISSRKKMEADLMDAKDRAEESNRLKSAFLANMSHEIRTPLNAIVGFSEVLASAETEDEKREYVSIIENNNTLLLQLISDILDLSKIEAGTLEFNYSDVDVNDLLSELETSFKMRVGDGPVEIISELPLNDCCICTDKNRVTQVVINIVNNAIKFTKQGSIRFGYQVRDDGTIYFYVKDTGCGIAKENIESVFGRFVKLNNFVQGTGLGLSICQTIINHMGGQIGVESEKDKGSTFWFTLPYSPVAQPAETVVREPQQRVVEKTKLTVLIAEDNASNFKLFEAILQKEYTIYHAWDGQQAVDMFKEYRPHIVLMDINMPKLNGYEATQEIRKISAIVPIIAVTAYAYTSDEKRIKESGFDGYTAKPINSQMLKSQMVNLLKRQLIFI
ncbi:MAG: ATP-binding protein [Mucinivorans sp.]